MFTQEQIDKMAHDAYGHLAGFTDGLVEEDMPVEIIMHVLAEICRRTAQHDPERQQQHLDTLASRAAAMAAENRAPRKPGSA